MNYNILAETDDVFKCGCGIEYNAGFSFCPACGKPQMKIAAPTRGTRAPNGSGYIYKRGNSWAVRVRKDGAELTKTGFKTKKAAADYVPELTKLVVASKEAEKQRSTNHGEYEDILMKDLYDKMMIRDEKRITKSTLDCYRAAYHYCEDLYEIPFCDLNTEDWQMCVDDCPRKIQTKRNIKALGTKLYKYANELRVFGINTQTDFATFVWIPKDEDAESRLPFSSAEFEKLKNLVQQGDPGAEIIYTMCCTGFRPTEFLQLTHDSYNPNLHILTGGAKTDAGKNRAVPVHPSALPYVEKAFNSGNEFLFGDPKTGQTVSLRTFRDRTFYPTLARADIQPIPAVGEKARLSPYSTRHTFSTRMKEVNIGSLKDKAALMGHTSYKMTLHYQHEDYESLTNIISHIEF